MARRVAFPGQLTTTLLGTVNFFPSLSAVGCLGGLLAPQREGEKVGRVLFIWVAISLIMATVSPWFCGLWDCDQQFHRKWSMSVLCIPLSSISFSEEVPQLFVRRTEERFILSTALLSSVSTTVALEGFQPRLLQMFVLLEKLEDVSN